MEALHANKCREQFRRISARAARALVVRLSRSRRICSSAEADLSQPDHLPALAVLGWLQTLNRVVIARSESPRIDMARVVFGHRLVASDGPTGAVGPSRSRAPYLPPPQSTSQTSASSRRAQRDCLPL